MKATKTRSIRAIKTGEKFITNEKGKREFVILPIKKYDKLIEMLEDYGLAKAVKEVQKEKTYSLDEALKLLDD